MKEVGHTQNSLSEELDMTQGGLQHWLAGTREPSLDDINRIADLLSCPRAWLTHGVSADDTIDGLPTTTQAILRQLIRLERASPLPSSFWSAVQAMAEAVTPPTQPPVIDLKSETPPRNGTHG